MGKWENNGQNYPKNPELRENEFLLCNKNRRIVG
jgi:hypothetical protein